MQTPTSTPSGQAPIQTGSVGSKIVIFPDGTRIFALGIASYSQTAGVVGVTAGNYSSTGSSSYSYTAQNATIANAILSLLDVWLGSPTVYTLNVASALGQAIYTISPTSQAHGTATAIAVTGQGFAQGSAISVASGGVVTNLITTYSDSGDLSAAYSGSLAAGTYDVTVSGGGGATFVLPGALTLT